MSHTRMTILAFLLMELFPFVLFELFRFVLFEIDFVSAL